MIKIGIALSLCFLLFACTNSSISTPVPKDIIPVDTMIMVMSDLALMESVIQKDFPHLVRQTEIVKNSGDTILKKYSLDFERYKSSLEYYTFYSDTMVYIYNHMSDRMTTQLNDLQQ